MARPAFRTTYYQNYPEPFYPGSSGRYPVPGWGARPVMAGPARVGVGQLRFTPDVVSKAAMFSRAQREGEEVTPPPTRAFPWALFIAGVGVVGGLAAVAYNRRWIGKGR